jgi:hypothetical protein
LLVKNPFIAPVLPWLRLIGCWPLLKQQSFDHAEF